MPLPARFDQKCGKFFFDLRNFTQAKKCYERAFKKAETWEQRFTATLMIGNCCLELGRPDDALHYYRRCESAAREKRHETKLLQVLKIKEQCLIRTNRKIETEKVRSEIEQLK